MVVQTHVMWLVNDAVGAVIPFRMNLNTICDVFYDS